MHQSNYKVWELTLKIKAYTLKCTETDKRLINEENIEVTQQIEFIRNEITTYYEGHPVTEIWNSNMFANLYQQIIFSITIRAFKEEKYIFNLIKDIDELIDHLRELAMNEFNESNENKKQERKKNWKDYGNNIN